MTALSQLARSSAFRLLLVYLALFVAVAVAAVVTMVGDASEFVARQALQTVAAEVRALREQYRIGGVDLLKEAVANRSQAGGTGLYLLAGTDGKRIAGNLAVVPTSLSAGSRPAAFSFNREAEQPEVARLGLGSRVDVPGGIVLIVARDITEEQEQIDRIRRKLLFGLAAISVLGALGAAAVSHAIQRRIDAITKTSSRIMSGDLSGRIPVLGHGRELDQVAASLNEMLERIELLVEEVKEVSDNVAHDLKTPLTRLRARAEAALADPRGETALRAGLEGTIEDADELMRTFNALLSIARLEAGVRAGERENVDLGDLVAGVCELYQPAAEEAGLRLLLNAERGVCANVHRQLIVQAVANLIDNAIKYGRPAVAGPAPVIEVSVVGKGAGALISVGDRGPGVPKEQLDRVLKRFVRLEASRSQPGSGLGLSLVAAIARHHGGRIALIDNSPGLRIEIELPALAAAGVPGEEA
ncbi:MAG: HAMP domain-containing protein [Hyphomicrobiaceae bacterium]|nr:MAG: HAMP domain-containing protein [Hyphomicrobiaceae bacterium]